MSLSKNQLKFITSLRQKKYRLKHNLFIVEGVKTVDEFLNSDIKLVALYYISDQKYETFKSSVQISDLDLNKMSALKSPNEVLALFEIPENIDLRSSGLILVLDGINDPGNLGTIIRLCDWYGIEQMVCSKNTVDCFNPKVVQATMGSLTRVAIYYADLENYLSEQTLPKYATTMNGDSIYDLDLSQEAILVMGNEANGISNAVFSLTDNSISIPRFGELQKTESLNVASATAILLSEFKRPR